MKKDFFYYLNGYPDTIKSQVQSLYDNGKLHRYLLSKYPMCHDLRNEKHLYKFTMDLKNRYLKKSAPLSKVSFNEKIDVIQNALGMHTTISRAQGHKLKSKKEITIASVFKKAPEDFLTMIVVHELAHFKEREHNKAFYNLCCYMQPEYFQVELDLRIYLTYLNTGGELYK